MTEFSSRLGIEATTVGNGDMFLGPEGLMAFASRASYPYLGTNLVIRDGSDALNSLIQRSMVKVYNGVKVGVLGLVRQSLCEKSACGIRLGVDAPEAPARAEIAKLQGQGVKIILALTSEPAGIGFVERFAADVSGIDAFIMFGRDSREPDDPLGYVTKAYAGGKQTAFLWARTFGREVGVAHLAFNDAGDLVSVEGLPIETNIAVPLTNSTAERLRVYEIQLQDRLKSVVGSATVELVASPKSLVRSKETNLGNFITDAMVSATRAIGTTIALTNAGGIRASIPAGNITQGQVLQVAPFSNIVSTLRLRGVDLLEVLQHSVSNPGGGQFMQVSGIRFAWNPALPPGIRVVSADTLGPTGSWEPVESEKIYSVATNNYVRRGGDGYHIFLDPRRAIDPYDYGPSLDDVLLKHLQKHSPVAPEVEGRIVETSARHTSLMAACNYELEYTGMSGNDSDACAGTGRRQSRITWEVRPEDPLEQQAVAIDIEFEVSPDLEKLEFGKESVTVLAGTLDGTSWAFDEIAAEYTHTIARTLRVFSSAVRIVFETSEFHNGAGLSFKYLARTTCPAGFYYSNKTQACAGCPAGSWGREVAGPTAASTACTPCAPGSYSSAGSAACQLCAPGHFQPDPNAMSCRTCPVGSFQNATGQSHCDLCPPGSFSDDRTATSCTPCPVGMSQSEPGSGVCQLCPIATFMPTVGAELCAPCPNGTSTNSRGSINATACSCRPGYFHPLGKRGRTCLKCPLNGHCDGGTELPAARLGFYGDPVMLATAHRDAVQAALASGEAGAGAIAWVEETTGELKHTSPYCTELKIDRCSPSHEIAFLECVPRESCSGSCDLVAEEDIPGVSDCRRNASNVCVAGRTGRMCAQCAADYFSLGGNCLPCPEGEGSRIAMTFFASILVICLWLVINKVASGDYDALDILLLYLQIGSIIGRFALRWSPSMQFANSLLSIVNFDVDFVHPTCVMDYTPLHTFYAQLMLPLLVGAIYGGLVLVAYVREQSPNKIESESVQNSQDTAARGVLSFLLVTYHTVTILCLNAFECQELPDGSRMLLAAPQFDCDTPQHQTLQTFAALGLVFYVLGFPLLLTSILVWGYSHNKLSDSKYLKRYSFLYGRYSPAWVGWELLLITRRFLFCAILVLMQREPLIQAALASLVLVGCIAWHFFARPFIDSQLDLLESLCIYANFFFTTAGILFFSTAFPVKYRITVSVITLVLLISVLLVGLWITRNNIQRSTAISKAQRLLAGGGARAVGALQAMRRVSSALAAIPRRISGTTTPALADPNQPAASPDRLLSEVANKLLSSSDGSQCTPAPLVIPASLPPPMRPGVQRPSLVPSSLAADTTPRATGSLLAALELAGTAEADEAHSELCKTIEHQALTQWVTTCSAEDLQRFHRVALSLAPAVSDEALTSVFSFAPEAAFYRNVQEAFPRALTTLAKCSAEEVTTIRRSLELLFLDQFDLTTHFTVDDLIVPQDRSSVLAFLLDCDEDTRSIFNSFVQSILTKQQHNHDLAKSSWLQRLICRLQCGAHSLRNRDDTVALTALRSVTETAVIDGKVSEVLGPRFRRDNALRVKTDVEESPRPPGPAVVVPAEPKLEGGCEGDCGASCEEQEPVAGHGADDSAEPISERVMEPYLGADDEAMPEKPEKQHVADAFAGPANPSPPPPPMPGTVPVNASRSVSPILSRNPSYWEQVSGRASRAGADSRPTVSPRMGARSSSPDPARARGPTAVTSPAISARVTRTRSAGSSNGNANGKANGKANGTTASAGGTTRPASAGGVTRAPSAGKASPTPAAGVGTRAASSGQDSPTAAPNPPARNPFAGVNTPPRPPTATGSASEQGTPTVPAATATEAGVTPTGATSANSTPRSASSARHPRPPSAGGAAGSSPRTTTATRRTASGGSAGSAKSKKSSKDGTRRTPSLSPLPNAPQLP